MQLRVKELREAKGWNQTVLAYHAGLSPSQVSLIETGKRNPTATTLKGIADALGVEVGDLFPSPVTVHLEPLELRSELKPAIAQILESVAAGEITVEAGVEEVWREVEREVERHLAA
jgi:transcriptional regulator with XRE-family HTH domain